MKKILSIVLAMALIIPMGATALAATAQSGGKPYSPLAKTADNIFGAVHDAAFGAVQNLLKEKNIPTAEEFVSSPAAALPAGTNGPARGTGWSGGFSSASIIPASWRCDADGNRDPAGLCLKKARGTGGYQTNVSKLYTDQRLNMIILSNGIDTNKNGVSDIMIFVSIDGVGITAGTCREIRKSVYRALKASGCSEEDVIAFNVSATHCHAGLDTQGMNIPTLFLNKLNPFTDYNRSLNKEMQQSICDAAAKSAGEAFKTLEKGELSFFETERTDGAHDKLNCGAKTKGNFSCFLFEGESGSKTIITNIGAHPTSYGAWNNKQLMCTDYPYFMSMALSDQGYNLVFTQSAEASVNTASVSYEDGDAKDLKAQRWVNNFALSKEGWVERYGQKYADEWYDELEEDMHYHMKRGFLLSDLILQSINTKKPVKPVVNIKNAHTLICLDNGVMALGSISGLLGENVVKYPAAESGYALFVETNYLELGDDIAILTAPGELSPTLTFGTDPDYTGEALWTGKTSWAGEDWKYDTVENSVRKISGDSDKTVLILGITNDAMGYFYPDICTPKSLLATLIFYKENPGDMTNCMLMTPSTVCGSQTVEGFEKVVKSVYAK